MGRYLFDRHSARPAQAPDHTGKYQEYKPGDPKTGGPEPGSLQAKRHEYSDARPENCQMIQRMHGMRSEEHTSELQSLMRISYAVLCLNKKIKYNKIIETQLQEATTQQIKLTTRKN